MVNISTQDVVHPIGTYKGAALLLVDLQGCLALAIPETPRVVPRIARLIEEARRAGLPILATEQYSRGLGPTVPELRLGLAAEEIIEKIHFAATREAGFVAALRARGLRHCFVAGMEAHVCVLQTVLGLLATGVAVTVLGDAVASRADLNRRAALARMARAGAAITDSASLSADLRAAVAAPAGHCSPEFFRPE
ncbi:MAG: isochorismatase family protein [Kiloniellaceae bacterium]